MDNKYIWNLKDIKFQSIHIDEISINDTLTINLISVNDDKEQKFRIIFETFLSFFISDESYIIKQVENLITLGISVKKNPFLRFNDSELIRSFYTNNFGLYNNLEVIHYAIYTENDCIDILATKGNIPDLVVESKH